MADFDTEDIITLHSHTNVRFCIYFQFFDFPSGRRSNLFTRVLELVPGDDVNISVYNDLLVQM